jgi:hypothetical protein
LIASIRLKTIDGTNLPKGIEVESVWVVNGELLWSPPLKKLWRSDGSSSTMEVVLRNGPKWGPGIKVDVVIRVRDGKGRLHLIKASGQNINRTD